MAKEEKTFKELLEENVGDCAASLESALANAKKYVGEYGVDVRLTDSFKTAYSNLVAYVSASSSETASAASAASAASSDGSKKKKLVGEQMGSVWRQVWGFIHEAGEEGIKTPELKKKFNEIDIIKDGGFSSSWSGIVRKLDEDERILKPRVDEAKPILGKVWSIEKKYR